MIGEPVWIVFLAILGGCVGSFLNVVIHRLPRAESLIVPRSHCPRCRCSIRWFDNIPVLSYFILRARCRSCGSAISIRYCLIELSTAVAFVALYDAFYKSQMHMGLETPMLDGAVFAAHLALLAGLIVCSVLDIEYYLIDLRIVYVIVLVGLAGWVLGWRAGRAYVWPAAGSYCLAGSMGVVVGELIRRAGVYICTAPQLASAGQLDDSDIVAEDDRDQYDGDDRPTSGLNGPVILALVYAAFAVALIVATATGSGGVESFTKRACGYVGWLFFAILLACIPRRRSDKQIVDQIHQERTGARAQALRDLITLIPALAGLALAVTLVARWSTAGQFVDTLIDWRFFGRQPIAGLAAGLSGLVAAVSLGWAVRILFTLVFGKEAMGVGDIYILAAVGATAGAMAAVVGFFVGSVIGVFAVILLLLWKTSRALSYGPWIAIGTLVSLLFYNSLAHFLQSSRSSLSLLMQQR